LVWPASPVCRRAEPRVSEGRPRSGPPGWWSTGDHREAGQTTRARPDHLAGLGDLRETLRRAAPSTEGDCPSWGNLVEI